ncbi:hypothetical protein LTR28_008159, partial [Elasticomyces elasticus]
MDRIFRAVLEDWQSVVDIVPSQPTQVELSSEVQQGGDVALGLPGWSGVYAGAERLVGLIRLLNVHITVPGPSPLTAKIGMITDLLTRLFSLTVPKSIDRSAVRLNPAISRDEREGLWTVLPGIHCATMELLLCLLKRFGRSLLAIVQTLIDQVVWVFSAEKGNAGIRTASYSILAEIITLCGRSMTGGVIAPLAPMVRECCNDLLPIMSTHLAKASQGNGAGPGPAIPAPSSNILSATSATEHQMTPAGLQAAASHLLTTLLSHLPAKHTPSSMRILMDRTAVLTQHKDALLASVLNPVLEKKRAHATSSVMPLLARGHGCAMEVEGLLRPRMPVILTGKRERSDIDRDADEIDEHALDDEADELAEEEQSSIGDPHQASTTSDYVAAPVNRPRDMQDTLDNHSTINEPQTRGQQTPMPRESGEHSELRSPATKRAHNGEIDPLPSAKRVRILPELQSLPLGHEREVSAGRENVAFVSSAVDERPLERTYASHLEADNVLAPAAMGNDSFETAQNQGGVAVQSATTRGLGRGGLQA